MANRKKGRRGRRRKANKAHADGHKDTQHAAAGSEGNTNNTNNNNSSSSSNTDGGSNRSSGSGKGLAGCGTSEPSTPGGILHAAACSMQHAPPAEIPPLAEHSVQQPSAAEDDIAAAVQSSFTQEHDTTAEVACSDGSAVAPVDGQQPSWWQRMRRGARVTPITPTTTGGALITAASAAAAAAAEPALARDSSMPVLLRVGTWNCEDLSLAADKDATAERLRSHAAAGSSKHKAKQAGSSEGAAAQQSLPSGSTTYAQQRAKLAHMSKAISGANLDVVALQVRRQTLVGSWLWAQRGLLLCAGSSCAAH